MRQAIAIQSTHIFLLHRDQPFSLCSPPHWKIQERAVHCLRRAVSNPAADGWAFPPIPCTNSRAAMQLIPEAARTVASWPSTIGYGVHRSVIPGMSWCGIAIEKVGSPCTTIRCATRLPAHALPTISLFCEPGCHLPSAHRWLPMLSCPDRSSNMFSGPPLWLGATRIRSLVTDKDKWELARDLLRVGPCPRSPLSFAECSAPHQ
ncbi:hypothetical protein BJX68DRAFT_8548 [Aspergillus pseudodeflectus]|uniref:Uncharacterized protein n=1 Tax=Aspergillus pseudodeflectus TaxID=176178 RepID=A0ABR4LDN8_9EURO